MSRFAGMWVFGAVVVLGCSAAKPHVSTDPKPAEPAEPADAELPRVTAGAEFAAHAGQRVVVDGTYVQVDVRKRIRDANDVVHRGHVAVQLDDGHRLHIEPTWSKPAIRTPAEIQAFENRRVEAIGTLRERCPTPPQPAAAIISPCLVDVTSVELVGDDVRLELPQEPRTVRAHTQAWTARSAPGVHQRLRHPWLPLENLVGLED